MDPVSIFFNCINCLCTATCLHDPLARKCNYLRGHREKGEGLKTKMEQLSAQANDIRRKLELANVQDGNEPQVVVKWRERVLTTEIEVQCLMENLREEKRCLNGCIPNYRSRFRLGKEMEKKTAMVTELINMGQFSNDQLIDLHPGKGKPLPTTPLVGNITVQRNFENILKHVMDDNIGMIGVFGMGGVGKTTIMQDIYNHLLEENTHFGKNIFWVTVPNDSDLEKLQTGIGKKVNPNWINEEDKTRKASLLLEALQGKKKFMLILDDMWKDFPLESIGIPYPTRENGCKIVLTTRLRTVCRGMKTDADVEVRVLYEDEAWDLFKKQIGEDVLHSSDILALAKKVAKECGGLPLALTIVGKALRQEKNVSVWKNALNELRNYSTADINEFEDQVFGKLKFSYTRLRNDLLRDCFLYCALYPEDQEIEPTELVEHWIGEHLIDDLEHREDQIDKGITVLEGLKNAGMLENSYDRRRNKMHDLVRDLAIRIQHRKCIIKAGCGLKKAPRDEEWKENLGKISLMRNELEHLTGEPKCPNLSSLLLQDNPLRDISHPFFQHMHNLKVVNLSFTDIEFLPKSLVELKNLRALFLSHCKKLRELPSLANLESLRTLDLSNTFITELPPGMEMLGKLRRLDLWCCKLRMFPAKLLQKLTQLEELCVVGESFRWRCNAEEEAEGGACGEELISATELRMLQVEFSCSENFGSYIDSKHWRQLTAFAIHNQEDVKNLRCRLNYGEKYISIRGREMNVGGTCLVLPDTTHELDMRKCDTLTRLSMCLQKSAQLQECKIMFCKNMECIVMAGEDNLSKLETMSLSMLPMLSSLCKGVVAPGTLSSLKVLRVHFCENLKNLLTRGLLQHLQRLESFDVCGCHGMKEIVGMGEDGDEKEKGEEGMMSGGSDEANNNNNSIITLPSPSLPGDNYLPPLPKLSSLCKGVVPPGTLSTLKELKVSYCMNLKNLLTRGLLQHLQSLETIDIKCCEGMEEIIVEEAERREGDDDDKERGGEERIISASSGINNNTNAIITTTLPKLHTLHLIGLKELKSICSSSGGVMVCNSLQSIRVEGCGKLKKLAIISKEANGESLMAPPAVKKIIGNIK